MASLTNFTDDENKLITKLYNDRIKISYICFMVNKTEKQVLNQIKRLGLPPRQQNKRDYFIEINENGKKVNSAKKFNVWVKQSSYDKIYNTAKKQNKSVSEYVREIIEESIYNLEEDDDNSGTVHQTGTE
jgi:predicted HicB family RNase H-like nuclease